MSQKVAPKDFKIEIADGRIKITHLKEHDFNDMIMELSLLEMLKNPKSVAESAFWQTQAESSEIRGAISDEEQRIKAQTASVSQKILLDL